MAVLHEPPLPVARTSGNATLDVARVEVRATLLASQSTAHRFRAQDARARFARSLRRVMDVDESDFVSSGHGLNQRGS